MVGPSFFEVVLRWEVPQWKALLNRKGIHGREAAPDNR